MLFWERDVYSFSGQAADRAPHCRADRAAAGHPRSVPPAVSHMPDSFSNASNNRFSAGWTFLRCGTGPIPLSCNAHSLKIESDRTALRELLRRREVLTVRSTMSGTFVPKLPSLSKQAFLPKGTQAGEVVNLRQILRLSRVRDTWIGKVITGWRNGTCENTLRNSS